MPKVNINLSPQQLMEKLISIQKERGICFHSLIKDSDKIIKQITEINRLKAEKNAIILAHTYVIPEIIYGVGDFVGDSYALSKNAKESNAKIIVFAAVRFMGETAKIICPDKEVFVPGKEDGCTLADCITANDVKRLRRKFPDYTFVCYINTTAEVKAECDVCVTSANVNKVVAAIPSDKIYFLPDKMMGQNLITQMKKEGINKGIKYYNGTCYVHEEYTIGQLLEAKKKFPKAKVISHPECLPEVCAKSDFIGSTSQLYKYIQGSPDKEFLLLTECGLASRIKIEFPDKRIVGTCTFCKYMKSNALEDILRVLTKPLARDYVRVNEKIRARALKCIDAMFKYAEA
ncbi:MAG: quinolinate synthase NadA [Candidatus Omnitrophica bacterium]|nr:quinolinate synthase NadA [Candidatus Omnitrophota bacterium]